MIGLVLAAALALVSPEPSAAALTPADLTPPRPEQLMAMPDALRQQFRQYALSRGEQNSAHVDWVVDFLFRPEGLGMVYRHDATYTVAEAFQTRTANCLTFTLLTVALAREAGLEAYGQQIAKSLAWRREGNTIYRTIHVNAGIRVARRRLSLLLTKLARSYVATQP